MGCGCGGGGQTQQYKVIAADGSSKTFANYNEAQQEANKNGGRIRVTTSG